LFIDPPVVEPPVGEPSAASSVLGSYVASLHANAHVAPRNVPLAVKKRVQFMH
jgi:hypothetical protein